MLKNLLKRNLFFVITFLLIPAFIIVNSTPVTADKFNMSYLYFGNTSKYTYIDNTNNSLNEVSPNYFDIDTNGKLLITPALDTNFIKEMHLRGIKVVPFLSNHWDKEKGIKALSNRIGLAKQLAAAIKNYSLDGINIDIENLTETQRDSYTDFVRLLNESLPSDKVIAIAVAPNPFSRTKGWQGSYDYKNLGKYADYLMIMAYDEHYQGSVPGPVASSTFVEKSIKYAIDRVSKNKIVLGIPFYGRYWMNGQSYGGYGISSKEVEKLIKKYNGKVIFDKATQSAKGVFTIKATDVKPILMGKALSSGTYTVWYENEQSIKSKLSLVQKYDLKGTGSWSLGQEPLGTWNYYAMWLNGRNFLDVQGHWAQSSIMSMYDKGWMTGISSNQFAPNTALTRAQAVTVLVQALGLKAPDIGTLPFKDISEHWAQKNIEIAYQNNIIVGQGNGKFAPDVPISRQEMAVLLDRTLTELTPPNQDSKAFTDINATDFPWSFDSIIKLADCGVLSGYKDGSFYPQNLLTRAEMASLMNRVVPYIPV